MQVTGKIRKDAGSIRKDTWNDSGRIQEGYMKDTGRI